MTQYVEKNKGLYLDELQSRLSPEDPFYYQFKQPIDYNSLFEIILAYKQNKLEGIKGLRDFILPEHQDLFFKHRDNLLKPGVKLDSRAEMTLNSLSDIINVVETKLSSRIIHNGVEKDLLDLASEI